MNLAVVTNCCCEPGCEFFSDSFASDDLATNYDVEAGSWAISGGTLHSTSTTGLLVGNTEHPDGAPNIAVRVTLNTTTSGDSARILLDWQDSSNYWYARITTGTSGLIQIYKVTAGTHVIKSTEAVASMPTTIDVCVSIFNSATLRAHVNVSGIDYTATAFGTFTNPVWGLGTWLVSGTINFTNLSVSVTSDSCPQCDPASVVTCNHCDGGSVQRQFLVEFTGVTNNLNTHCAEFNQSFILDYAGVDDQSCFWKINVGGTLIGSVCIRYLSASHAWAVDVNTVANCGGGGDLGDWLAPDDNCNAWNNTTFTNPSDTSFCHYSGVTCKVTAIS